MIDGTGVRRFGRPPMPSALQIARSGSYVVGKSPVTPAKKERTHARRSEDRLHPICPAPRCSRYVLRRGPQIRSGNPEGRSSPIGDLLRRAAAADRFTGKNGVGPRHHGAGRPQRCRGSSSSATGKESELDARAISSSSAASPWARCRSAAAQATIVAEFAAGALKADQVADLALGARLRAYTVRPLQDQAEGRRRTAEQGRGRASPARARRPPRKPGSRTARYRRRRRPGARPRQRAGQRALSERIRAPRIER